jgi:hypothetical protein
MLSFSISYWDLIKIPYFADTTERGDRWWKEAQRQGEDRVTLEITLMPQVNVPSRDIKKNVARVYGGQRGVSCDRTCDVDDNMPSC